MARIVITRPSGETEYAELTTDKALAGNDRLTVDKNGTTYYAKLDPKLSTHMFVIKPDGRKLYVQKEVKFVWEYTFNGEWENASKMVIPRTGKYRLTYDRWDTYDGTTTQRTETKDAIFESGIKWIRRTQYYWNIQDKSGKALDNSYSWDNGMEEENPEYEDYSLAINKIEYIGEA